MGVAAGVSTMTDGSSVSTPGFDANQLVTGATAFTDLSKLSSTDGRSWSMSASFVDIVRTDSYQTYSSATTYDADHLDSNLPVSGPTECSRLCA